MPDMFQIELGENLYPNILTKMLGSKAPKTLYCLGNISLLTRPSVGFCGSRKASEKGLETARDCASQASELGMVVVSGNAAGVDVQAHYHALSSGGSTIIVLPEGIDHFRIRKYLDPVWNWERVLVVSQFEPQQIWQAYRAMARNKVIISLSGAMIVIEAGERGGTLDAGRSTLDMGLPLFVAQYENMISEAQGNKLLLEMGGVPLNRLRSTNRANMARVNDSLSDPNIALVQPNLL